MAASRPSAPRPARRYGWWRRWRGCSITGRWSPGISTRWPGPARAPGTAVAAARPGTFYGHAMTSGDIYTVAGDGTAGFSGDGGPATSAELNAPASAAVDGAGNLVIADSFTARVRAVAAHAGSYYGRPMTAADIYTVAGNGKVTSGDRGPALAAELGAPAGTAVDSGGNTFVADGGTGPQTSRVQLLPASPGMFFGQAMTAGNVYTVAGTGKTGFTGDGGPATSAELSGATGLAADAAGNLVISDWGTTGSGSWRPRPARSMAAR